MISNFNRELCNKLLHAQEAPQSSTLALQSDQATTLPREQRAASLREARCGGRGYSLPSRLSGI